MGKIKRLVEENPHGICEAMVDSLQTTIKTLQERTNTNSYTVRVYCDRQGVEVEEVVNLPDHIATSLSIIGVVARVMTIAEQQHSGQCGTKHDPCISEGIANASFRLDPKQEQSMTEEKTFIHYDTRTPLGLEILEEEVFDLQVILENFGTGEGDLKVEYPEFYTFLMTANVGDSKSGMYGQGTYDCWKRIS